MRCHREVAVDHDLLVVVLALAELLRDEVVALAELRDRRRNLILRITWAAKYLSGH